MKKELIILLILLPIISAASVDMKSEFSQSETLMAKVSANFYEPVVKGDVFFYREHVRMPMSPFVTKIGNNYHIYAQLSGKSPDNYSMVIKNVKHTLAGQVIEEDLTEYFSISNSTADFSINPGFIVTNENFFIEALNLQDSEITIEATSSFDLQDEPITLNVGEEKRIYFNVDNDSTSGTIKLKTNNTEYNVPVSIFGLGSEEEENETTETSTNTTEIDEDSTCEEAGGICKNSCDQESQLGKLDCGFFSTCCSEEETEADEEEKSLEFESSELTITMPTNTYTLREIYLYNTGEETIEDITLFVSGSLSFYINLPEITIDELEPGESAKVELEFYSFNKDIEVEGKLTAKEEDILVSSDISLGIIKGYVPLDDDEYEYRPSSSTQTCNELDGEVCDEDETCDTDYVYAKDNKCCLGNCGGSESSSTGKIIGWSIVGVVVIFLAWFFLKKYKGAKKPVDLEKIARGKKK